MDSLLEYENEWGVSEENPHKISFNDKSLISFVQKKFDISDNSTTYEIQEKCNIYIQNIVKLHNDLKMNKELDSQIIMRVNKLLEIIYYAKNILFDSCRFSELMELQSDYRDNCDASIFRFTHIDSSKNNAYQNLLLYILDVFYERKYARYN